VSRARYGDEVAIVLNQTPFYAESGGQIGDTGHLMTDTAMVRVTDTQKTAEEVVVHYGVVERGEVREGELVDGKIELERRIAIMRNHTATHLLQGALKQVVGKHVTQQGSYVGPDHLRFDFTNHEAVSPSKLVEIESLVNDQILQDLQVETNVLPLED